MTIKELEKRIADIKEDGAAIDRDAARDGERRGRTAAARVSSAVRALLLGAFPPAAGYIVKPGGNNHFTTFGMVQNTRTGRIAYYSFSDYRHWGNSVLWRSAAHFQDWTGGRNNTGQAADLVDGVRQLID